MASRPSRLAWERPWTEKPGGLHSPWGHEELDTTEHKAHKTTYLGLVLIFVLTLKSHPFTWNKHPCSSPLTLLLSTHRNMHFGP